MEGWWCIGERIRLWVSDVCVVCVSEIVRISEWMNEWLEGVSDWVSESCVRVRVSEREWGNRKWVSGLNTIELCYDLSKQNINKGLNLTWYDDLADQKKTYSCLEAAYGDISPQLIQIGCLSASHSFFIHALSVQVMFFENRVQRCINSTHSDWLLLNLSWLKSDEHFVYGARVGRFKTNFRLIAAPQTEAYIASSYWMPVFSDAPVEYAAKRWSYAPLQACYLWWNAASW
jgi:hypothetical protein